MMRFLQDFGIVQHDNGDSFRLGSMVLMMVLMLTFIGATIYILTSSLL